MSNQRPDEEYEQVKAEVPKRTKELAKEKLEHGGLTRVIREALAREAHGERTTERERVKDHLQTLRDERRELKRDRDEIDAEIEQKDVEIERAENRLETLDNTESEYEGMLKGLDELLDDGTHVFSSHAMVERAADVADCSPEDVIDDLRDRNPDLPDNRFEPAYKVR